MPIDPAADYEDRARMLYSVGRFSDALALTDQTLAIDPTSVSLIELRIVLYRSLSRPTDALESANALIAIDPNNGVARAEAAHALLQLPLGEVEALQAASAAVTLAPDSAFAWLQLVRAHIA